MNKLLSRFRGIPFGARFACQIAGGFSARLSAGADIPSAAIWHLHHIRTAPPILFNHFA